MYNKVSRKKILCSALSIGVLLGSYGGASIVYAESAPEPKAESAIELEDSYVHPDYVEVERLRDTKQIIVIRKEDIEGKGYRTVSDVLQDVPSISVGATFMGDIDIRGQGDGQATRNIQVLLDGSPITTISDHPARTNYDVVPIEQIEKIEIIPGGGSVLYGSGAAGGVINITTNLRSMDKPKSSISTEWNSDGYRLNLNYGEKVNDKITTEIGYSKLDRDLYFKNTYRDSEYLSVGVRYDVGQGERLTFRGSNLKETGRFVNSVQLDKLNEVGRDYEPAEFTQIVGIDENGQLIKETRKRYLDSERDLDSYNITYQKNLNDKWRFSSDLFYTSGFYRNSWFDYVKVDQETKGVKFKLDHAYGEENNLLIGIDYYKQKAENTYDSRSDVGGVVKVKPIRINYGTNTTALYLLNNIKNGKYTFTQGVRREKSELDFDKIEAQFAGDGTKKQWNTAAELSTAYHYSDTGRVFGRWERGYTALHGPEVADKVTVNGKKILVPTQAENEKFDLFEIGLRDKMGISTVNLTLFSSNTDNQVSRVNIDKNTINMYQSKRKGAELSFTQKIGKLSMEEGYAYLRGRKNYTAAGRELANKYGEKMLALTQDGLMKVPKHKINLNANYAFDDQFSMGLNYTYVGKYNNFTRVVDRDDAGLMQSHSLLDLDLKYKVNKDMEWYGGVTNLLNRRYYDYGYKASIVPGSARTYYFGVKHNF
ncbi:TonB-dependent receptor [Anaerosinus massiliensis]|uniref:TonB-dependent receptor n=1 Tax=Massilibacillus massiliensis TaxID=1806837 RepID=UPI000B002484|nr:TonB-dependent receptor plug domain-containing protein [Massilibacillus massiliensis]